MLEAFKLLVNEPVLFYPLVVIFGLLVGSFLNVVIHRLPVIFKRLWRNDCHEFLRENFAGDLNNEQQAADHYPATYNLLKPRSSCPKCHTQISALENIPVLSYLWQKGRCKHCQTKISARYPFIELLSAGLALVVVWKFGPTFLSASIILLTWALICLTFIDIDHQYLPDQITLPFLWLGLLLNLFNTFTPIQNAVLGAVFGYLVLWMIYHMFKLATGKEGMGYGDFKLLALLGAWQGWQMIPTIIVISSVVGTIIGVSLILLRKHDKEIPIAFGPYLALAGWLTLLWGPDINHAYFSLLT